MATSYPWVYDFPYQLLKLRHFYETYAKDTPLQTIPLPQL
jgi:hypothetical protein